MDSDRRITLNLIVDGKNAGRVISSYVPRAGEYLLKGDNSYEVHWVKYNVVNGAPPSAGVEVPVIDSALLFCTTERLYPTTR